jgi:endonuclease/exonuclease/phosphatase family metal-dependent hydrolase
MKFSIFVWNVWHINQTEDDVRFNRLKYELKKFIDQYRPDIVALSEVVKPKQFSVPPLVEYLQELGYKHNHCAKMGEFPGYWMSGVTLSSRFRLSDKQNLVISRNASAIKHGYPNINKEVIAAKLIMPGNKELKIIVAHPPAIATSFKNNRVAIESLDKLVHSEPYVKNTILVGDMNQWRLMPDSFRSRAKDAMHSQTGTLWHPTWRHNASSFTPLRLNLDYIYWSKQGDLSLKSFQVLEAKVSDHQPLLASIEC